MSQLYVARSLLCYKKEFWQTEVFEEKLSQGNLFGASDRRQWICPNVLR